MNLNETRKDQGVEIANREHAKGAREWPTLWPTFVAFLHRFRLGMFYSREAILVIFQNSQAGRPCLSRPTCFSLGIHPNFFWNVEFTLLI